MNKAKPVKYIYIRLINSVDHPLTYSCSLEQRSIRTRIHCNHVPIEEEQRHMATIVFIISDSWEFREGSYSLFVFLYFLPPGTLYTAINQPRKRGCKGMKQTRAAEHTIRVPI